MTRGSVSIVLALLVGMACRPQRDASRARRADASVRAPAASVGTCAGVPVVVTGVGAPLEAPPGSRAISFTTEEGTWMSVDVSPDGTTVVFDLLGDLYTLPIAGGMARRISGGVAIDTQPRFSPDGTQLVFTSDRDGADNLWVMPADGSGAARQLTHDALHVFVSPTWTPEGDAIVTTRTTITRRTPFELLRVPLGGGPAQSLLEHAPGISALGAAFAADGRSIWVSQKPTSRIRPFSELGEYQLASLERATGRWIAQSEANGGGLRPQLSRDGRWLAFGSRFHTDTGLRVRDLASGDEHWLTYPVTRDDQEAQHVSWDLLPGYAFTPDSRAVVIAKEGKLWRVEVPSGRSTPIPFTADVRLEVAPLARAVIPVDTGPSLRLRQIQTPARSRDGRLAFAAQGRVWIVDRQGVPARAVTTEDTWAHAPSFSSDGRTLLYATWDDRRGGQVMRVPVEGGTPLPLPGPPALYLWPAEAPGGAGVAAVRMSRQAWNDYINATGADRWPRSGTRAELVWWPRDSQGEGAAPRVLAPLYAPRRPHFGPPADQVAIYQPRGFGGEAGEGLVHVPVGEGSAQAAITVDFCRGDQAEAAKDVQVSPRGDALLVLADDHVYRVDVAASGAPSIHLVLSPEPTSGVTRLDTYGAEEIGWAPDGTPQWVLGTTLFQAHGAEVTEATLDLRVPRPVSPQTLVLRGARLVTMRGGADDVIDEGAIVIRAGRIVALGPVADVPSPAGASVIDMRGRTILPGFLDTHAHFGNYWGSETGHPTEPWELVTQLAYGVTTAFDPSGSGRPGLVTTLDMIDSGRILGPRVYTVGSGVDRAAMYAIRSVDDARALVRRYVHYLGHEVLKYYVAGNRRQRQWFMQAAREQGAMVTAEGNGENRLGIADPLDGLSGHEHYFPMVPLYRDVVQLVARTGTWYTPTLIISHGALGGEELFYAASVVHDEAKLARFTPHGLLDRETRRRDQEWEHRVAPEEVPTSRFAAAAEAMRRAGGHIGVGAHGQRQGLGYHWELQLLASGGMSARDVLHAATLGNATNLGLDRDLGSLEAGKVADLLVLDEDPLEDIRNTRSLRMVMKQGQLWNADTLDEVWPTPRRRDPTQPWGEVPEVGSGPRGGDGVE